MDKKIHEVINGALEAKEIEPRKVKRPYIEPKIVSAERLEAAAATCEPANAPFGKDFGPVTGETCGALGS